MSVDTILFDGVDNTETSHNKNNNIHNYKNPQYNVKTFIKFLNEEKNKILDCNQTIRKNNQHYIENINECIDMMEEKSKNNTDNKFFTFYFTEIYKQYFCGYFIKHDIYKTYYFYDNIVILKLYKPDINYTAGNRNDIMRGNITYKFEFHGLSIRDLFIIKFIGNSLSKTVYTYCDDGGYNYNFNPNGFNSNDKELCNNNFIDIVKLLLESPEYTFILDREEELKIKEEELKIKEEEIILI